MCIQELQPSLKEYTTFVACLCRGVKILGRKDGARLKDTLEKIARELSLGLSFARGALIQPCTGAPRRPESSRKRGFFSLHLVGGPTLRGSRHQPYRALRLRLSKGVLKVRG